MDQPVHAVFPRETCHVAVSVCPSATYEIARDADVERAMEATGEDVDVVSIRRHLCCLPCPWVPALRPSGSGRDDNLAASPALAGEGPSLRPRHRRPALGVGEVGSDAVELFLAEEIGRASCRESVCEYVYSAVWGGA